ncbi:MAG: heavy-metal-associated domain-containing protein [Xanthomonadales bacterium]|nr:heavy-metal-associated domain-containing protein [Xanthomonadaceae bacterium]MBN8225399.1 heavy-metal-associated domain-containing protein [Xanthomonadales bacterium]
MKLVVEGMTCGHCAKAVTGAIHGLDSDAEVLVDLAAGTVRIDGRIRQEDAVQAIQDRGYTVSGIVTDTMDEPGSGRSGSCCGCSN